jgi:tRNA G18 (ribose-2'-O)-methylase SpoU
LTNRRTRSREGRFLVQGVAPITAAVAAGWPLDALLHRPGPLSAWAAALLDGAGTGVAREVDGELLATLGERDDGPPEMVAVASFPSPTPVLPPDADLVLVGDRTASPGNLGTMIRSADALGAAAVMVVGHAADPYDPQAVRASRGSLFAVPVLQPASAAEALDLLRAASRRSGRRPFTVVAATEDGPVAAWEHDWRGPTALVVGQEATGVSRAWRDAADVEVAIPQTGSASSLNAAVSAGILLYEARRPRR